MVSPIAEPERSDDEGSASVTGGAVRAEFDWSAAPPSTAVVETVAIATDRRPMGLEPLYGSNDPDALDSLIQTTETPSAVGNTTVAFVLDGHEVVVQRDGTAVMRRVESRTEPE